MLLGINYKRLGETLFIYKTATGNRLIILDKNEGILKLLNDGHFVLIESDQTIKCYSKFNGLLDVR